jgi:hypothetical protein
VLNILLAAFTFLRRFTLNMEQWGKQACEVIGSGQLGRVDDALASH